MKPDENILNRCFVLFAKDVYRMQTLSFAFSAPSIDISTLVSFCRYFYGCKMHRQNCAHLFQKSKAGPDWIWPTLIYRQNLYLCHQNWHKISLQVKMSIPLFNPRATPSLVGRQCWGKSILPGAGYGLGTYLIFVIFFTLAKFLENKIYTEKRQFFALNL